MQKILFSIIFFTCFFPSFSQPKMVVGIVVDQMRYDYLYQFRAYYGQSGFNRLLNKGVVFHQAHYTYTPTFTGPGHATVYTGTTPAYHGIIANDWFSKDDGRLIYCASDNDFETVGTTSGAGQMSPRKMLSTTIGDAMQLFYGEQSKVFGVSLKDRGAILPAGHSADGAFWFDGKKFGNWITSSYYTNALPEWVDAFNKHGAANNYLKQPWELSPILEKSGIADLNPWEGKPKGKQHAMFPYDVEKLAPLNGQFDVLKAIPHGNDLTADFAIALTKGEQLGQDNVPDMLAVSFSSTDYVGHQFGTRSLEIADAYVRLDNTIARFLKFLDNYVGVGQYVVFLTADHAAIPPGEFLRNQKIPSGLVNEPKMEEELNSYLKEKLNEDRLVLSLLNEQIFLNWEKMDEKEIDSEDLELIIVKWLENYGGIDRILTREELLEAGSGDKIIQMIKNGFHPRRSGDIIFNLLPGWAYYGKRGSTHGSAYVYDTHVPLIFYSQGLKPKHVYDRVGTEDIAPTVSTLLKCTMPNAATGIPLQAVLNNYLGY